MSENLKSIVGIILSLIILYLLIKGTFKVLKWLINLFITNKKEQIDLSNLNAQDLILNQTKESVKKQDKPSVFAKFFQNILLILMLPIYFIGKIIAKICYIFQDHCPKCDSSEIKHISTQELDRWQGSKKVREKLASGKIKEKYVNATYVLRRRVYQCNKCGYSYHRDNKEEK
ncbi:hypothetical protein A6B39_01700 [Mannheimia granulomatis]|uniref:hypothetical protein n=1 Tax=Mannheimia granulomatis TaxID=85402 RepID=UPI00159E9167|nr:hypothetical protein [Mannheimia granulomatis]QLB14250.1 hypothetical protein A6B39_01700 [Mannheimia granulomatis]